MGNFTSYIKRDGNEPINSFVDIKIIDKLKDLNQEDRNDIDAYYFISISLINTNFKWCYWFL